MPQIEIDFEVFKELTIRRRAEEVTYNEVIRELLNLGKPDDRTQAATRGKAWTVSDTTFPPGSEFMSIYRGSVHSGVVRDGKLELNDGCEFTTPSAAAMHITGSNVNGWRFWKCKLPGTAQFVVIELLRGKSQ